MTNILILKYQFEILGMGENNASFSRPLHLSRDVMTAASVIYDELYRTERGINATFQLIYLVGWKPGPNQPEPIERGSANASFKDLSRLTAEPTKKRE